MIDRTAFAGAWKRLCRRFNRPVEADELAEWYAYLSPRLETEEFLAAAQKLWASREFFPRPDDFLKAVRPSQEAEAASQWELCLQVMAGERGVLERMTPAGQKTVALLGGPRALGQTPVDEVHFRRREFLERYPNALESSRREGRVTLGPWSNEDSKRLREAVPNLRLLEGGS